MRRRVTPRGSVPLLVVMIVVALLVAYKLATAFGWKP